MTMRGWTELLITLGLLIAILVSSTNRWDKGQGDLYRRASRANRHLTSRASYPTQMPLRLVTLLELSLWILSLLWIECTCSSLLQKQSQELKLVKLNQISHQMRCWRTHQSARSWSYLRLVVHLRRNTHRSNSSRCLSSTSSKWRSSFWRP